MMGAIATEKGDCYDKWRAESDMRTVVEAQAIQKDPKRMADVRRAAKEKSAEMDAFKKLAAGDTK